MNPIHPNVLDLYKTWYSITYKGGKKFEHQELKPNLKMIFFINYY